VTALLAPRVSGRLACLAAASLIALLVACSVASLGSNYRYPKQDFEGAMAYVEEHRASGDRVVTAGVPATFCYQNYYNKSWPELREAGQLAGLRGSGRPVWLVCTFPRYIELANADLAAAIWKQFKIVREFHGTLSGGAVLVCRAEPTSQGNR
jgi:hypothetical protein